MATAIANAMLLGDADGEAHPAAILIEGERIVGIARGDDMAALVARAAAVHDARGALAVPGFVNAHHHSYGDALRGAENDLPLELWSFFTVAWGRALDAGMMRLAILLGAAEMLRAGYTAVLDHAPHFALRQAALSAHRESGLRVGFAPMLHDLHDHAQMGFALPDDLRARIEGGGFPAHDAVAAAFHELSEELRGDARVRLLLGPNAPQRCSPDLLALWRRLRDALALPVHTHLLETRAQAILCRTLWPDGVVAELERRGLLEPGLSVAHCVWAEAHELDLIARHGVAVVHNPASNLMLGSGIMPYDACVARGIVLGLGSDSANTGGRADPFEAMRLASMLPRVDPRGRRFPGAREVLAMAGAGGAAALGLSGETGQLATGRLADLVLLRLGDAATAGALHAAETVVRHASPAHVEASMVGGTWAYRDGRILAFDEAAVLRDFAARAGDLVARAAAGRDDARMAAALLAPGLAAYCDPHGVAGRAEGAGLRARLSGAERRG